MSFNVPMRIPGNITAIDGNVLGINLKAGPTSEDKYLKITKWAVTSNS